MGRIAWCQNNTCFQGFWFIKYAFKVTRRFKTCELITLCCSTPLMSANIVDWLKYYNIFHVCRKNWMYSVKGHDISLKTTPSWLEPKQGSELNHRHTVLVLVKLTKFAVALRLRCGSCKWIFWHYIIILR